MLKPAVLDGAEQLWLEQEVPEPWAMDSHVPPVETTQAVLPCQIRTLNHEP
jgi:hypothetical protein